MVKAINTTATKSQVGWRTAGMDLQNKSKKEPFTKNTLVICLDVLGKKDEMNQIICFAEK